MNFADISNGIALLCDDGGVISYVLHNSLLGDGANMFVGHPLTRLIDRRSMSKALSFLVKLRAEGAIFDWEMGVPVDGAIEILHFAGVAVDDQIFVMGAKDRNEVFNLYDGMVRINNEQMNALRSAVKQNALLAQEMQRDQGLYDELTRLNNELVNLQRELTKKNMELSRLNELKNRFLGMAAHDLRNPLAAIQSYSEFLIEEAGAQLSPEHQEFVATIYASSRFMANLVNDLLDISTIESGQLRLDLEVVDLIALIRRNVELNSILAHKKGITLTFASDGDIPPMVLDVSKIEQVINNLVSNAIKYSYPDSPVSIRLARQAERVVLSVADEGQGIPAEEMDKLFEYFGRTSVQSTAGEPSTGLGLAIARNIVVGHGGEIWAESQVGEGSTFYVSLPIEV
jgi:signal transduction histidine kinase